MFRVSATSGQGILSLEWETYLLITSAAANSTWQQQQLLLANRALLSVNPPPVRWGESPLRLSLALTCVPNSTRCRRIRRIPDLPVVSAC